MNTNLNPIDYLITDVSLFTYTYSHDSRYPSLLEWDKLANQESYLSDFRIELPLSLVEMAVDAPNVLQALMLGIKPTLQMHGFQQTRENLYSIYTSIPTFESTTKESPWNFDYDTWRYFVKYSYGIPFTQVHPLQVRYLQEIFEAVVLGKRMSSPVKRKFFGFTPRPFKGCSNIFRYGIYPLQAAVGAIPVIRTLDLALGSVFFYGQELGIRAVGHATALRKDLSHLKNRTTSQIISTLSNYSQRKRQVASELLSREIDKVILAIPGVLVGLASILVIASEPSEWTVGWLKNWAEAFAGVTSTAVIAVDGKYLSEKWGWSRK